MKPFKLPKLYISCDTQQSTPTEQHNATQYNTIYNTTPTHKNTTTHHHARLFHTREVLHHCLVHPNLNVLDTLEHDPQAYSDTKELLEPLVLMYNSLLETGDVFVAKGAHKGRVLGHAHLSA